MRFLRLSWYVRSPHDKDARHFQMYWPDGLSEQKAYRILRARAAHAGLLIPETERRVIDMREVLEA